jgi:hypothetical protein
MLNPLAVYAFVAAATAAQGTHTPDLAAGTRVRIVLKSDGAGHPHTLRGTITAFERNTLRLTWDDEAKAVVLRSDEVARLQRLHKPGNRKKGAVIGASILGGAMAALLIAYCSSGWGCDGEESARSVALVGGSAALGALLGIAASHGDQWRDVALVSR